MFFPRTPNSYFDYPLQTLAISKQSWTGPDPSMICTTIIISINMMISSLTMRQPLTSNNLPGIARSIGCMNTSTRPCAPRPELSKMQSREKIQADIGNCGIRVSNRGSPIASMLIRAKAETMQGDTTATTTATTADKVGGVHPARTLRS